MLPTYLLCSENTSGIAAYFFMNIFIIFPYINIYMENSYTNFGYMGNNRDRHVNVYMYIIDQQAKTQRFSQCPYVPRLVTSKSAAR